MKDFLEKVKDILYDGIDYIIMIGIIAAIAFIINWKLDRLFTISDVNELYAEASESTEEKISENENNTISSSNEEESDEDGQVVGENNTEKANKEDEIITINIPAGSLPGDIGNILASEGLVESKDVFLKRVTETNTEKKLKYGEYKISKNSSIDEILDILTK